MANNDIMVSIGMSGYNHEKFIAQSLESVLRQEVDFAYEIIIGEDCSQDRTREIILSYQKRYPHIIKPLLYEKNVGMSQNYLNIRMACKGKYRTTLEGDDFWIERDRLKRQVEFLENNQNFCAVAAKWITLNERDAVIANPFAQTYFDGDVYTLEAAQKWLLPAHTCTMMYRNYFRDYDTEILENYNVLRVVGDRKLSLFLALHGNIYIENRSVAARRIVQDSQTSYYQVTKRQNMYYVLYSWTQDLEAFAEKNYAKKLDYSEARLNFWLNAISAFVRLPCLGHFKVARSIYKASDDKKRYRLEVYSKSLGWLKKIYGNKGFIHGTKDIALKLLLLPKRVYRFSKLRKMQKKHNETLDSFI